MCSGSVVGEWGAYNARLNTDTDSDDQYAQCTLTYTNPGVSDYNVGGVVLRMNGMQGNAGYAFEVGNEFTSDVWSVYYWSDGTTLDSGTGSGSPADLYFEFNGSNWDAKINSSSVSTGSDASFSGILRMGVFTDSTSSGSTDVRIDDFEGGDIGGTPPPHAVTGAGDVTLPVSALDGAGQVEIVSTGDVTLPVSALAGTGVIQIDGTGTMEFLVSALASDGTVSEPVDTALPYKHFEHFDNVSSFLDLR